MFSGKHLESPNYFEGRVDGKWNFLKTSLSLFQLCFWIISTICELSKEIHKIENDVVEGGPLPNFLMVWYILSLSIHLPLPTHLRLPQQNNLRPAHYYESPIAQWLEHPTGIWKVVGLILDKGSDFLRSISSLYLIFISSNHSSMCCFLLFIIFVNWLSVPPGKGC